MLSVDHSLIFIGQDNALIGKPQHGFLPQSFALWMTALYVGLFIIRPWEILFPQLATMHFERCYGIFMVLCVGLTCGFRLRWNLQNTAVAAFVGTLSLSTILAWDVQSAWEGLYVYLTLLVCYCVLISVIRSPYDLLFIIGAYIGFMELYLGKALWEYFVYGRHQYTMSVSRLIGIEKTFGHPNAMAVSIVFSLPLWLFLWKYRRDILAEWPESWRKCIICGLVAYLVLAIWGVALTNSRTGMLSLCIFAFLSAMHGASTGRIMRNVVLALLVVGVGWLAMPEEQKNRVRTTWDSSINASAEASTQGRVVAFHAAMEIFRRFPIIGVGLGNFIPYREQCVDGVYLAPHNLLGNVLSETGLLGAAAFAFLVTATLVNCMRTSAAANDRSDPNLRVLVGLTRACRDSIILLLIDGIVDHNLCRFNWLWLAAFCSLAAQFASEIRANIVISEDFADMGTLLL